jgi:hypothetical protein
MSYTTPSIANRIGYNRGWLISPVHETERFIFLKSFLILKEYLRFYQVNLLSFSFKKDLSNTILINIYKHIPYMYTKKSKNFFFYRPLNKKSSLKD